MKKRQLILFGVVLFVAAVTVGAVLLLHRPPLIREDGIESIVITTGQGHKELTDPEEQEQVLKLLNGIRCREAPDNPRKGWNTAVYVFYEDHSRTTLWFAVHTEDYTDEETGITHPAGDYLSVWPDSYYSVKEGTTEAVDAFADSLDRPYEIGILPEYRMRELGMID